MASQIYVAYTEGDWQIAHAVCAALERGGARGWVGFRDVPPGSDRRAASLQAIDASSACVLILSPYTTDDIAFVEPVNRARERGLPLIALRMGNHITPPALSEALRLSVSVVADLPPSETQLSYLVQMIQTALPQTPQNEGTHFIAPASGMTGEPGSAGSAPSMPIPPLPTVPPIPSGSYASPTPPQNQPNPYPPVGAPYMPLPVAGAPDGRGGWQVPQPFQSILVLGWCVIVLLIGHALLDLAGVASGLGQAQLLSRMSSPGGFSMAEVTSNDHRMQSIGIMQLVLLATTAVFLLTWMYRSYRNLYVLGAQGLTLSPGWAAGGFFVPILNLFRPYQAMSEIWRASDPRAVADGPMGWQRIPTDVRVGFWWGCWLINGIIGWFALQSSQHTSPGAGQEAIIGGLLGTTWGLVIADFLSLLAGVFLISIVLTVSRWQEQRGQPFSIQRGLPGATSVNPLYPILTAMGLVLLLCFTGGVVAGFQSLGTAWKEFSPPGGEFTVLMPGDPKADTKMDSGITIHLYQSGDGAAQYLSSYFDIGQVGPVTNPEEVLDAVKKSKESDLHGSLAEEHKIMVGSHPGLDYIVQHPQGPGMQDMRLRTFIVGNRFFQFLVMGSDADLHSPDVDKFYNSIRVPGM